MAESLNILVIEDRNSDFLMLGRHLKKHGLMADCSRVDNMERLKEALRGQRWDLVLSDYNVPLLNFQDSLALVQEKFPDVPVIMVTGSLGEERAVELLKLGVWDFVLKGNLARLVPAIRRSLSDAAERRVKQAAIEALRQSEEMYHSLFDNMLNGFALCRMIFDGEVPLDFVYMNVNSAFEKLTGLTNVVGKRVTEIIPGIRESDPEIFHKYGRVALTGIPERFEIYVEAMNIWFSISVYSPAREQFITVFDVITERKLAETSLRESEERLNLALRGANDGLWDWNLKTGTLFCSPRWKSMLGYADEELAGSYDCWKGLLHADDVEPTLTHLREFLDEGIPTFEVEFRMRHKEGTYVDILSRAFLLYSDQGEALRMVGTHVDITDRKKLEEQFRQAQKLEAVGQLAGGVAHDFNNILSAIFGYSHLILDMVEENSLVKKYVEQIMVASKRAATLTQALLAVSRKQPVILQVVDLCEIITGFEEFLRRLIREDIELKIRCAGEPLTALADRGQIEQVIMNLAANSRDAMPSGGSLVIEALPVVLDQEFIAIQGYGKAGAYTLLAVSDSGFGMDDETRTHIFEPFFTTKEQGKGTGLGLSMVYGIVRKHDGFITVDSAPGKGTVFKIYLPRIQDAPLVGSTEIITAAALRGGAETILIGEDDALLRGLAAQVLSKYGYRIIEAVDGKDAVDRFLECKDDIRLVILDLIMPNKNGKVACNEMRVLRPDLKVIFTSGYAREIMEGNNTFEVDTDFIHKPIPPNDLVARVREVLDRK